MKKNPGRSDADVNFDDSTASGLALPYSRDWCSASFALKPTEETHCISPCNISTGCKKNRCHIAAMSKNLICNKSLLNHCNRMAMAASGGTLPTSSKGSWAWDHHRSVVSGCFILPPRSSRARPCSIAPFLSISINFYPFSHGFQASANDVNALVDFSFSNAQWWGQADDGTVSWLC